LANIVVDETVTPAELQGLERKFLILIDWNLWVSQEEYVKTYDDLTNPSLHCDCDCKFASLFHHKLALPQFVPCISLAIRSIKAVPI
jgi:hypothetical protein